MFFVQGYILLDRLFGDKAANPRGGELPAEAAHCGRVLSGKGWVEADLLRALRRCDAEPNRIRRV
jgi:hypothetical protein